MPKTFMQLLHIPSVARASDERSYRTNEFGIAIVGLYDGSRATILLMDMQHLNSGASLTNVAEHVINFTHKNWLQYLGVSIEDARWVELDSVGAFDVMSPVVLDGKCMNVNWRPLINAQGSRTLEAFVAEYGSDAEYLYQAAQDLVDVPMLRTNRESKLAVSS